MGVAVELVPPRFMARTPELICEASMEMVEVEMEVIKPLALTVAVRVWLAAPNVPMLELTLAKVVAIDVVPLPVISPVKVMVWLPVK